jgi:hypothetical protein
VSKKGKLLKRFLEIPNDFTFNELKRLLKARGYEEKKGGKTSGSRIKFVHTETRHIIMLHKPHTDKYLKRYQIKYIIDELKKEEY